MANRSRPAAGDALRPDLQLENEKTYTQVLERIENALFFTGSRPL
mgnify:CR=1 FL=1